MLAALNALRVVGKRLEDVRIVVTGVAPQARATRTLLASGAQDVVGCDREGRSTVDAQR